MERYELVWRCWPILNPIWTSAVSIRKRLLFDVADCQTEFYVRSF